jgi:hypothetical protein
MAAPVATSPTMLVQPPTPTWRPCAPAQISAWAIGATATGVTAIATAANSVGPSFFISAFLLLARPTVIIAATFLGPLEIRDTRPAARTSVGPPSTNSARRSATNNRSSESITSSGRTPSARSHPTALPRGNHADPSAPKSQSEATTIPPMSVDTFPSEIGKVFQGNAFGDTSKAAALTADAR